MHRTYRWLDAPPRLFGLTFWQWLVFLAATMVGYGLVRLLAVPTKVALVAGVFLLGVPLALALLSEGDGLQAAGVLRDLARWVCLDAGRGRRQDPVDALGLTGIGPDGLAIRTDGVCLRYLEVLAPVNPLIADEQANVQAARMLGATLARLAAGQSLQFYVQAQPVRLDELVAGESQQVALAAAAVEQGGRASLAAAMRRLGAAAERSLAGHCQAVAAMSVRHVLVVPWTPARGRRAPGLERTAHDSLRHADGVRADLEAAGLTVRMLDGPAVTDLLWSRFDPDAAGRGTPPPSFMAPEALGAPVDSEDEQESALRSERLAEAVCTAPFDLSGPRQAQVGDGIERVLYLAGVPERTWLGWLLHVMQSPLPFSLSVHFTATDRLRERQAQRRRWRRLRGVNLGVQRRGRPVDPQAEEQEQEAEQVSRELALSSGAGIHRVGVYLQLRAPATPSGMELLGEQAQVAARELSAVSDARVEAGVFAQRRLWRSSLPLADDRAGRARKYLSVNAADTIPLVGTGCGSPTGIPFGYAQPGRTVERIDPFDAVHENHMMIVAGKSGTGKTMSVTVLLARAIGRGLTAAVIDRAGHFQFLTRLIPGAREVRLGAPGDREAICPWDVDDPERVEQSKVDYLLALHSLLLGRGGQGLGDLEESLLAVAIREVYARCALTGERPRELILQEELHRRHASETSEIAATLRNLALRLNSYVADGPYAYLTDWPTSVPADAPLTVFDTRAIPDSRTAAALFVICGRITERIETDRARQLADDPQSAGWRGRHALVIDEAWKLVQDRASGRWLGELARRSRHLGLWLIGISQQLSDFENEHGRALLQNAAMRLLLHQDARELSYMREALQLTGEQVAAIAGLQTAKRQYATAFLMNGTRGSGTISIRLGPEEYWLASSDPVADEPLRERALRQTGGDAWRALELLADPAWQAAQQQARAA